MYLIWRYRSLFGVYCNNTKAVKLQPIKKKRRLILVACATQTVWFWLVWFFLQGGVGCSGVGRFLFGWFLVLVCVCFGVFFPQNLLPFLSGLLCLRLLSSFRLLS